MFYYLQIIDPPTQIIVIITISVDLEKLVLRLKLRNTDVEQTLFRSPISKLTCESAFKKMPKLKYISFYYDYEDGGKSGVF